jgi:hypothetical protein
VIRARRHPVPDLIQVVLQPVSERIQLDPVNPGRALVTQHLLPRREHLDFRDIERLGLLHF